MQFLIEQGADWKAKNINGQNVLDLARLFFKSNVVQYLESKGNNTLKPGADAINISGLLNTKKLGNFIN